MKAGLPRRQKGAAAIEFALVFVIFFAVLYGVVSYSLPLLLLQSFNNATAEAVRRSVAVDPTLPAKTYNTAVEDTAKAVLKDKLSWVPGGLKVTQTVIYDPGKGILTVTASLPASELRTILPVIVLPGNIRVPNLPDKLESVSSMKF